MKKFKNVIKKGDTLIEVAFSIAVFSLVSVITIQVMDRDLATIQGALEYEMARNEIDAQAEALRFIQNSYLAERELADPDLKNVSPDSLQREYRDIWLKLSRTNSNKTANAGTGLANYPENISTYSSVDCKTFYEAETGETHRIFNDNAFVINTRKLNPDPKTSNNLSDTIIQSRNGTELNKTQFAEASLYPRIVFTNTELKTSDEASLIEVFGEGLVNNDENAQQQLMNKVYNKVARAEGIWVISARQCKNGYESCKDETPEFYDFHIRTCWFAPGHERPSTVATTIRLYNPEYIEDQR